MNDVRFPSREPVSPGPGMLGVLVAISAGAFLLGLFAVPAQIPPGALSVEALLRGEWWSVLTHLFIHQDIWHLVTNMILLVLAGRAVQRYAGPRHFLYIFLFSSWVGAALTLCLRNDVAVIGASGGAWGLIGAFVALYPEYDLMRAFRTGMPVRLKAKRLFPAFLAVHVGLEIAVRSAPQLSWMGLEKVAHLVHAGGLLTGWLYGRRVPLRTGPARHP